MLNSSSNIKFHWFENTDSGGNMAPHTQGILCIPIAIGTKDNDSRFLNILYWFEERRNTTDNMDLPSSFIYIL
jgi:hypothetical protein